jgi:O-antigen ligase
VPVIDRVLTAAVPAAAVVAVAWSSGGYFPRTWGAILLLEAIALAAVAILATRLEFGAREATVVAALVGLAVWQLASRAWAVAPDATVLEAERTLLYAGAAASAFLAVTRDRAEELVVGVLAGAGIVTVGGLVEHALGTVGPDERLEVPVGYANAAGILAAAALLLGIGLAGQGPRWRRGLGAGLGPPAAATLYLSLSRGSVLAAVLGLAVLALTARSAAGLARLAVVAAPSAVAVVFAARAGRFDEPGATAAEAGSLLSLALLGLVAALLAARQPRISLPRVSTRTAIIVAAAAGVLVVAGATVAGVREVRDRRSAPASQQGAPDRLLSTSTSFRSDYWDVAAAMARHAPLVGEGAGGFERTWLRERAALLYVRDAHNLYLETFAELGVVGLALLLVALLTPLLGVTRSVRASAGPAALAAYTALLAHAVLDWDWELPAVTLCTVFLGVALLRLGSPGEARRPGVRTIVALLGTAATLGVVAVAAHVGNGAAAEAQDALDRGDASAARREAHRARRFAPWSAEPWRLLGEAELAAGRLDAGRRDLRRATAEDPGSWYTWFQLAVAADGKERVRALARARALNPLAPELDIAGDLTDHP